MTFGARIDELPDVEIEGTGPDGVGLIVGVGAIVGAAVGVGSVGVGARVGAAVGVGSVGVGAAVGMGVGARVGVGLIVGVGATVGMGMGIGTEVIEGASVRDGLVWVGAIVDADGTMVVSTAAAVTLVAGLVGRLVVATTGSRQPFERTSRPVWPSGPMRPNP